MGVTWVSRWLQARARRMSAGRQEEEPYGRGQQPRRREETRIGHETARVCGMGLGHRTKCRQNSDVGLAPISGITNVLIRVTRKLVLCYIITSVKCTSHTRVIFSYRKPAQCPIL